jgi:trehalose/maltose hydrolase-like predicted phosphorylase
MVDFATNHRYEAVVLRRSVARDDAIRRVLGALRDAGMRVEITGDADAVAYARLWSDGIAPADVVNATELDVPQARAFLVEQLHRRGDVPAAPDVEDWSFVVDGVDARRERGYEALLTLADGQIGTTGAPLLSHAAAQPEVLAAGMYDGEGEAIDLLPAPRWASFDAAAAPGDRTRRVLDMHAGTLYESVEGTHTFTSLRFLSLAAPGIAALRAQGEVPSASCPLAPPPGGAHLDGELRGIPWVATLGSGGAITAAGAESGHLDRVVAFVTSQNGPDADRAVARVESAAHDGFNVLLREHRRAWAKRWERADVEIRGDDALQRATRLGLFHLIGSVRDRDEAAVGARGLSGRAYRGHVFWDAELFVLPFFVATHPAAARAMLEYRVRRLDDAITRARAEGRAGARFPWESARTGFDVTPRAGRDQSGHVVPIRTGDDEIHINGDIAWATCMYIDWTADRAFAAGPGLRLLVETARYWASLIVIDDAGRGHLRQVIGPDEYHEGVDDNAYTNVLARWNLRRAAAAVAEHRPGDVQDGERAQWLAVADAVVDNYDPTTGLYEQFAGFDALEPLLIADVAPRRPITADLLLGRDRVRGAQVVKQADVLMLHHLLPDEVAPGSLRPNLEFYEPRTAHGSSLSPAIHASVFARAGRLDDALDALTLAANIDLDDLTATGAGGVHLAAMGGVWQALAFGFMGLRVQHGRLIVDPKVPAKWDALTVRVQFRGLPLVLRADANMLVAEMHGGGTVDLDVQGRPVEIGHGVTTVPIERGGTT